MSTSFSSPCMHCYNLSFHKNSDIRKAGYYCKAGVWDDRGVPFSLEHFSLEHSGEHKRGNCDKRFVIEEA